MKADFGCLRRLWKAPAFSPAGFLLRAGIITVLFGTSELIGLRDYTTFLSGTSGNVNLSWQMASLLGLIHLLLYVAFILLVPIFTIAAGLLAGWSRWKGRSQTVDQGLALADEGRSNYGT